MRRILWIAFCLADAILILLFAAGYAARYVHPKNVWSLQLIAVGLPFFGVCIALATGIAIIAGSRALVTLHVLLCLLIVVRYVPTASSEFQPDNGQGILAVFTLNAKYKSDQQAERGTQLFVKLLEREAPHVLCMQELTLRFNVPSADTGLTSPLFFGMNKYKTFVPAPQYVLHHPVISRIEIEGLRQISLHPNCDSEFPNGVTKAYLDWRGRKVVVYNLHLRSFNSERPWGEGRARWLSPAMWSNILNKYREDFLIRAREAEQLRRLLDKETLPFIVCGDFNSTPDMWVYQHLSRGLKDAFAQAGNGRGATFPARRPLVRIDYILVSPEWTVLDAYITEPLFSDHLPTVARIAL